MKQITLLLFSIFLLGFMACEKEKTPKTMEEQIAECDFENTSASLTINQKSVGKVGAFKITDQIEKDKTIMIVVVGCDGDELHQVQITSLGFEESVIENGVYNVSEFGFDSEITLAYSTASTTSSTQGGLSLVTGESGTITVTDTRVVFDVIGRNPFTGSTVTIVGEGNF